MKNSHIFIILLSILMLEIGCSARYRTFSKAAVKLNDGMISRAIYDSLLNTLYVTNKVNFLAHPKVKLTGSYVHSEYSENYGRNDYQTLKFTDSFVVFKSTRFYDPASNSTLAQTEGTTYRYTMKGDEIVMEYLLSREYELYNMFKYATVSANGDTLTIFKTENLQRPNEKRDLEKAEKYIYNPTLTSLPILPH